MLEIMERLESSQSRSAELTAQQTAAVARVAELTASRDTTTGEIDAEVEQLQAQRATQAGSLDAALVTLYEKIRDAAGRGRRRRAAAAPVRRLPARAEQRRDQPAARRRRRRGHALRGVPPHPGPHGRVRAVSRLRRRGRRRVARQPGAGGVRRGRQGRRDRAVLRRARRAHRHRHQQRRGVPRPDRRAGGGPRARPDATVEARLDSKLVVEQLSGRWKIKHPDMRPLALRAREIAAADAGDLHLGAAGAEQARRPAGQRGPRRGGARRGVVADRQHGRAAQPGRDRRARGRRRAGPRATRSSAGTPTSARRRPRCCCGTARPRTRPRSGSAAAGGQDPALSEAGLAPGGCRGRPARGQPAASTRSSPRRCGAPGRPPTRSPSALGARRPRGRRVPRVRVRRVGGADVRRGPGALAGGARARGWATRRSTPPGGESFDRRTPARAARAATSCWRATRGRPCSSSPTSRRSRCWCARRAGRPAVGALPDGALAGVADRDPVVRRAARRRCAASTTPLTCL